MAIIHIDDTAYIGMMDQKNPPAYECYAGDILMIHTRDCYNRTITSEDRPYGDRPNECPNPATGPIYIHGAKAGSILKISILDIKTETTGVMRSSPVAGIFHERFQERTAKIYDLSDEDIVFDEHLTLKKDAMIGVIGTAPLGNGIDTETPGTHGGNMDVRTINANTTLYLPVNVDGALLAVGDVHALMGDGESLVCGLETGAVVTLEVDVIEDHLPLPLLSGNGVLASIASAETLDLAADKAGYMMLDLLKEKCRLDDFHAGMLLSLKGNLIICQVVNPLKTVRMELDLSVLHAYGVYL